MRATRTGQQGLRQAAANPAVWPQKVCGHVRDAAVQTGVEAYVVSEPPNHMRIELDLEVGSEPIRGRLGHDPEMPREFYGWIEFAAALEALMAETAGDAD